MFQHHVTSYSTRPDQHQSNKRRMYVTSVEKYRNISMGIKWSWKTAEPFSRGIPAPKSV